jgi:threonine/homoserine/homoserine lactone efflux protein
MGSHRLTGDAMFGIHDLPLFVATALLLNATPGVDLLFTLSRTLQQGWRAGVAAALGIGAGCVAHALAAALGLAALLAASAWTFTALKWAGAAYLLYLAFGMARTALRPGDRGSDGSRGSGANDGTSDRTERRHAGCSDPAAAPAPTLPSPLPLPRALRRIFLQGFLTNVLNPKVALFFLALLPQFIAPQAPHKALAFLLLGGVFVVNGTLLLLALVALAERMRRVPLRGACAQRVSRALHAAGATLFAALAARLALSDRS